MFKNITDFGFQRNWKQAIGFYLAYFLLIVLTAAFVGALGAVVQGGNCQIAGYHSGIFVAVIGTLLINFMVLEKKNQLNNYGYLLLLILSGMLAIFGGALIGLIPAAYFTTRKKQRKTKK